MVQITKREVLYSLAGALGLIFWFMKGRMLVAPLLEPLPAFLAFLIFNIAFVAAMYLLVSVLIGGKEHFKGSIVAVLVFIGLDIIVPPYLVTKEGLVKSVEFWYVSSDAAVGSLFAPFVHGQLLVTLTYVVVPVFLLFIIPIIMLQPKAIKKLLAP